MSASCGGAAGVMRLSSRPVPEASAARQGAVALTLKRTIVVARIYSRYPTAAVS